MRGLGDVLAGLGSVLPPWALGLLTAILLLALLPGWIDNMRSKQIRGAARRMVRAEGEARAALARRALTLAGSRRARLVALVDSAIKYDQRELRARGLAALEAVDARAAAELRARLAPERPKTVLHPLEVVVRVERLLDEGMIDAARDRLAEALARHPDDPELLALRGRVEAASPE